jgi:flavin-dependent dehydrogenase
MTGDGMRIAMRGAELAAAAGLRALQGAIDAHQELARARAREFAVKLRVNRLLRAVVAQPAAVTAAAIVSAAMPSLIERLIAYSGDATLTTSGPSVSAEAAI